MFKRTEDGKHRKSAAQARKDRKMEKAARRKARRKLDRKWGKGWDAS